MKPVSRNIATSLNGQSPPGRGGETVSRSKPRAYGPSMVLPGEGTTAKSPGAGTREDGRQPRSAVHFADAAGKNVGG